MASTSSSRAWAIGGLVFAATMMIMLGIWQVLMGIAAIANDAFFVVGRDYTYDLDTTAWGWLHLVIGALAVVAGFFLFTGATWARAVGITLAALSAINNFVFLPYFPLWSLVVIALDVFVIWSLATVGSREAAEDVPAGYYSGDEPSRTGERWPSNRPTAGRVDDPARAPAAGAESTSHRAGGRSAGT